jgi:MFS family permease
MTLRDDIAVLEDRRFRWFFFGRAVSTVGSSMTAVALAFAVLQIGSAKDLGLVMAVFSVCQIAFLVIGGVLADRLPRAVIIQSTYALTAVTQAAVATLFLTGAASIPRLLVLEGINGAALAFTMPAMQGLVPQLVPHQHLQQATALMSFVRSSAMIGGPVVGGALVVGPGPGWALAVDALTFVVAIACFSRIRLPRAAARATSMLADLRAGWSEFTSRTWLWVIVLAFGFINAIHAGAWIVLGPVVASEHPDALGARGWGMVLSAEAAGGILMTVVLMRLRIGRPLLVGMLAVSVMVVPLSILGVRPATVPLMVAALLAGAGLEIFGTGWNVAMMEHVPTEALSRVSSYDMLGSFIAIPLGATFFGWVVSVAEPRTVLVYSAIAYALIALMTLLVPSVRTLARITAEPAQSPTGSDATASGT